MYEYEPKIYQLPGALVEVHQPSEDKHYYAKVELDGNYPGKGKIAHNKGRKESLHWLEGRAELKVNNVTYVLEAGSRIVMRDGDRYTLEGKGKAVVFVKDQPKGTTLIEELE